MSKLQARARTQREPDPFLRPTGESLVLSPCERQGEILEAAMRGFGTDAEYVVDRQEAIVLVAGHRYDLVVLDFRRLSADQRLADLIASADSFVGVTEKVLEDGAPATIIVTDSPDGRLAVPCPLGAWTQFVLAHPNAATIGLSLECRRRDIERMLASAICRLARRVAWKRFRLEPSYRVRRFLLAELQAAEEADMAAMVACAEAARVLDAEAHLAFMCAEEDKIAHLPELSRRMEAKLVEIEFGIPAEVFLTLADMLH